MKAFSIIILAAICFAPQISFAQQGSPAISASVNPPSAAEGESVTLQVAVEFESSAGISTPKFDAPDFDVVGQRNSIGIDKVMWNGRFIPKRKNAYSFMLVPKKTGVLPIRNIRMEIGGKVYSANDQNVRVEAGQRAAVAQGNEEEDDEASLPQIKDPSLHSARNIQLNSDFTVRAEVSKRKAFVGEPIIAEYYLYDFGNLTRVDIKKWPTFNGFWKEDLEIPTRFDFQDEYASGRRVRRALLGRFALYPLKPGKAEVSKLIVGGTFISNTNNSRGNDPFNAFFGLRTLKQATHASQEEIITVEDLPTQGKPSGFSGAVGDFQIDFQADKTNAKANEPITFKFTVSGTGNFQSIEAPSIPFPEGFESFEASTNVQGAAPRGVRIDLKKSVSFDQLAIPRREGKFTLPAFEWSYFSPSTGSYKTARTKPIEISVNGIVQGATPSQSPSSAIANRPASQALVTDDIRYIKTPGQVLTAWGFSQLLNRGLIALLVIINLALLLTWTLRSKPRSLPRKEKLRRDSLRRALKNLRNGSMESLENAILCVFESILAEDCRGMTSEEIEASCNAKAAAPNHAKDLLQMLRLCHAERFSPDKKIGSTDFEARRKRLEKMVVELGLV